MYLAIRHSSSHLLREIINKKICKINLMEFHDNAYLLHLVSATKNPSILEIIKSNTNITELRDALNYPYTYPCIWYAAPHIEMISALLKLGATLEGLPVEEVFMSYYNNDRLLRYLIKNGMNINSKNQLGNSLIWAILKANNSEYLIERFRARGGDINSFNNSGITPLHKACITGNSEVVSTLLAYRADTKLKTLSGLTCTQLLRRQKHNTKIEALFQQYCK